MKWSLLFSAVLFVSPARGQTLRLDGGASTLFRGSGGQATMYFPNSTLSGSIGYHDHHFLVGVSDTFVLDGFKTTVGDQTLGFSFDGIGLGLALKGVSTTRAWQEQDCARLKPVRKAGPMGYLGCRKGSISLTAFVGATGVGSFFTPYTSATRAQHIGSGVLLQYNIRQITLFSLDVLEGGTHTLAQGASYSSQHVRLAGSGGLLNSQKYFSGSAVFQPIHPWSVYANHQSYFVPYAAQSSGVGTNLLIGRFTGVVGLNESKSFGRTITGENIGAGFRASFVSEQSTWYKSFGQTFLVHTITETMRHWTLTEAVNQARGRNSYSFGGGYSGHRISVSISHSIQFLIDRGYQQTTGIQVSFRIHDTVFNAQTVTDPFGKTQYDAYAESYLQTGLQTAGHEMHNSGGKYIFSGIVQDEQGQPMIGACLKVGREIVYSNEVGAWELRSRNNKPQPITVLLDEFQLGNWQIVSAPSTAIAGESVTITLKRKS